MSDVKLGTTPVAGANRDAIHIAVAPVTCDEIVRPGQHVAIAGDGNKVYVEGEAVGIVDPFLTGLVPIGTPFWLLLYPQTITSLRHEWTHPAFANAPVSPAVELSNAWLRRFASRVGFSYDDLVGLADDLQHGHACVGDDDNQARFDNERDDFLRHLSVVTGKTFGEHVYFSCAC